MRTIGIEEHRARLGRRHHLASPAESVETVAADMVGLHSSDPVTVYLSARARVAGFTKDDLEEALYERRSLVRMLGMRRTMFVVPVDLFGVIDVACTRALAPPERARLIKMLEEQDVAEDGAAWLERVAGETLAALTARGEATAAELTEDVPDLGTKLVFGEGKKWGGTIGMSTRVLFLLATEGRIVRGRPRGTWLSSQYRWVPTAGWIDGDMEDVDEDRARAMLLRRWLRGFGPGTLTDIKWWTGWTVRLTRATLADIGAVEVGLDDGTGYVLDDDIDQVAPTDPWVAMLPGLDPTVMGWKERDWYLGDHQATLFDRNGNAGPTVWADGRIVGGWSQRKDGSVVFNLLEEIDADTERMIEAEAGRLEAWLGEFRITPRFRTPLERELTG